MSSKISLLINTLNEEKNIENCLQSVSWVDEIIIVDMYSEDKTIEIAKKYTDKIFFHERLGYADPARQFGLNQTSHHWVLVIDADEIVPYKMRLKIKEIIEKDLADVVYFPRKNYYFGTLIQGLGWGPLQDSIPRLFKKDFLNFKETIHNFYQINPKARILKITNPEEGFIHFAYVSPEQLMHKINRYTTIEAQNQWEGKKKKYSFFSFCFLLFKEFFLRFFWKKGYKDGKIGFLLSLLMVFYQVMGFLKLKIMEKYQSKNPEIKIEENYQKIIQDILDEHQKVGKKQC